MFCHWSLCNCVLVLCTAAVAVEISWFAFTTIAWSLATAGGLLWDAICLLTHLANVITTCDSNVTRVISLTGFSALPYLWGYLVYSPPRERHDAQRAYATSATTSSNEAHQGKHATPFPHEVFDACKCDSCPCTGEHGNTVCVEQVAMTALLELAGELDCFQKGSVRTIEPGKEADQTVLATIESKLQCVSVDLCCTQRRRLKEDLARRLQSLRASTTQAGPPVKVSAPAAFRNGLPNLNCTCFAAAALQAIAAVGAGFSQGHVLGQLRERLTSSCHEECARWWSGALPSGLPTSLSWTNISKPVSFMTLGESVTPSWTWEVQNRAQSGTYSTRPLAGVPNCMPRRIALPYKFAG